jgi:hypothetical protein
MHWLNTQTKKLRMEILRVCPRQLPRYATPPVGNYYIGGPIIGSKDESNIIIIMLPFYQLQECVVLSCEKIKETPCEEIRQAYAECFSKAEGLRGPCRHIAMQLQECTAKHVGKLD